MALLANALLMIALPVAFALLVLYRTHAPATWLAWGALAFVLSQVVHLPILQAWGAATRAGAMPGFGPTASSIVLGLLAAGCEEPARLLMIRFALGGARGRSAALVVGAGHGGIEALVFGVLTLLGAINVVATRDMSAGDFVHAGLSADAAQTAVAQVAQALALPWYEALGGAFERLITIPFHIACSVLVMASLRRRSVWPFALAFVAHATTDASIGLLGGLGQSGWALELELAAMAVPFTALVLVWSARAEPAEAAVTIAPADSSPA